MKKIMQKILFLLVCAALVFSLAACAGEPGAKGDKGEQGIQGEQGEQGAAGEDGADGLSAYQLYCKYYPGYTGTEEEWVDDLAAGLLGAEHTITFDAQGGTAVEAKKVAHRNAITAETNRDGYVFLGWFADQACKTPATAATEDATVYAGWELSKTVRAEESVLFTGFRGTEGSKGISDAKSPVSADDIELDWSVKLSTGWFSSMGFPIEAGDYLYYTVSNMLHRLDKETGESVASAQMSGNVGFFSSIAYGDGKIFVPLGGGIIQAFDEQTLQPLWITETPKDAEGNALVSQQALSPITYHNGYIYNGITYGNASTGAFFCVSTADEDPSRTDEVKEFTWCYVPEETGGFYWSEGVVVGDCIAFAGEAGVLYTHSLAGDERNGDGSVKFIDSFVLPSSEESSGAAEAVRSSLCYDETTGRVLVATKGGNIHSVKVGKDGTIDETSVQTTFLASDITSSPAVYHGRVYVGGGGISSTAGITVLDAETLKIIYQYNGILTQSSPVLTTAYATAENNYTVYVYFLKYDYDYRGNDNPDGLYVLKDYQGNTQANVTKLMDSPNQNYNSSSAMISEDGSIYYKNDSGYLSRFSTISDNSFTAADVENAIALLPEAVQTRAEEIAVLRANYRYDGLSAEEQAKVSAAAAEKLQTLYAAV